MRSSYKNKDIEMMVKKVVYTSAACVFVIVGCSSSGSSDITNNQIDPNVGADENQDVPAVLTGVFVDSAVEGISYVTASQAGITSAAGEFS